MKWHFQRQWGRPHKRVIRVSVQAPLNDDPEPPENISGICPGVCFFVKFLKDFKLVDIRNKIFES